MAATVWGWVVGRENEFNRQLLAAAAAGVLSAGPQSGRAWGYYSPDGGPVVNHAGPPSHTPIFNLAKPRRVLGWCGAAGDEQPTRMRQTVACFAGTVSNGDELNEKFGREFSNPLLHVQANLDSGRQLDDIDGSGVVQFVWGDQREFIYLAGVMDELFFAQFADLVVWCSSESALRQILAICGLNVAAVQVAKDGKSYLVQTDATISETPTEFTFKG